MAGTDAARTSAATPLASASSCRWPSSPKPVTSVIALGRRPRAAAAQASRLSVVITVDRGGQRRRPAPRLTRGRDHARRRAAWSARARRRRGRRRCVSTSSGRTIPVTARPYFGSASSIEWPPTIATPGLGRDLGAAAQDLRQQLAAAARRARTPTRFSALIGVAAHRVDVRERVGGGDPAEVVRVVDDRREEVDRADDRQVVAEAVDAGVVGGVEADEHVGIGVAWESPVEQRADRRGRHLARAAGAVGERCEGNEPPTYDAAREWPTAPTPTRSSTRRSRRQ